MMMASRTTGHAESGPSDASRRFSGEERDEISIRTVRPGESVDLLALASLPPQDSGQTGSSRPMAMYALAPDRSEAVVARRVGQPEGSPALGVAALRPVADGRDIAEVFVFVVPAERERGLGRRLFDRIVEVAREAPVRRLRIRLPKREVEALGILARLSTHATVIPEPGGRLRIEFPLAAV